VVLPLALRDAGLAAERHWQLYLPVFLGAVALMVPMVFVAERRGYLKPVFLLAVGGVGLAELLLAVDHSDLLTLAFTLVLFFAAFNVLEATLPSLVSKSAPVDSKGSALGVYSSSQFLGAFVGGVCGGVVHDFWGFGGVFFSAACLAGLWFLLALSMENPKTLTSYLLNIGQTDADTAEDVAEQLSRVRGVAEAVVIADEGIAYLKVDRRRLDEGALRHCCLSG
jgi:MFS family permease